MKETVYGLENVLENDAIGVSLTGMFIVFVGLLLIAAFISYLPRVLSLLDKPPAREKETVPQTPAAADIIAAISAVIDFELAASGETGQRITIRRDERASIWSDSKSFRRL